MPTLSTDTTPAGPAAQLILASASPRRAELLRAMGIRFDVCSVDVDESPLDNEEPVAYVRRLALAKALAGKKNAPATHTPALGADTIVTIDGELLGKPRDEPDAQATWHKLGGRVHEVVTAVAVADAHRHEVISVTTRVWFAAMTEADMRAYWRSGEPCDKAGAYGIQGLGGVFIERIEGSYSAVVGLPVYETWQLLRRFGVMSVLA